MIGVLLAYSTGSAPQVHGSTKLDPSAWSQAEPSIAAKTASVNIAGPWRDNWGIRYDVEQEGRAFRFSASGPSCRQGYKFNASGSGTIDGASAKSNYSSDHEGSYNSQFQSYGSCQATLLANGTTMKSTCDDKVCGHNDFLLTRE